MNERMSELRAEGFWMLRDGDQVHRQVMRKVARIAFLEPQRYRDLAYGNIQVEISVDGYQATVRSDGDGNWFVRGQLVDAVRAKIRAHAKAKAEARRGAVTIQQFRAMAARVSLYGTK